MPSLRQLKALRLIARTGSFTKAAEQLFVTQSAVSTLMRELEEEVGVPLVLRGRSVRLTEAGEYLQLAGARAAQEIARAMGDIRERAATPTSVLRVAAGSLSAAALLPPVMARLKQSEPELRIVVLDRPVGMLAELLLSGEAHLAIGSIEAPLRLSAELRSTLLLSDSLVVVCSRQSRLAECLQGRVGARVDWSHLAGEQLILVGRVGGQWETLLQDKLAHDGGPRIGHEVQLFSTAIELVRHGLGVAVLPSAAARSLDANLFSVNPLDSALASWNTYTVTRKDTARTQPGLGEFLDVLKQVVLEFEH